MGCPIIIYRNPSPSVEWCVLDGGVLGKEKSLRIGGQGRRSPEQLESSKCFLWEMAVELNWKGHQGVCQEGCYQERAWHRKCREVWEGGPWGGILRTFRRLRMGREVWACPYSDSTADRLEHTRREIIKGLLCQAEKCDLYAEGRGQPQKDVKCQG